MRKIIVLMVVLCACLQNSGYLFAGEKEEAFVEAAKNGDLDKVQLFLRELMNVNARGPGDATALLAASAVSTAHGGTVVHDAEKDAFSATLKCHDTNGEIYLVNFSRDQLTLTSYEDDAIRTKVETWADSVPALA